MTKSVTINKEIVKTENLAFYKRDFFRSQKTPKEERFKKVCVNIIKYAIKSKITFVYYAIETKNENVV